jgi:hypothetical protein
MWQVVLMVLYTEPKLSLVKFYLDGAISDTQISCLHAAAAVEEELKKHETENFMFFGCRKV